MAMDQMQVIDQPQQPYIAQVAVTPEQALQAYKALKEITAKVLVKGTDYDTIPGTPKPSLLKPGAENLLRFYGLGHRLKAIEQVKDWDNGFFYFSYKVTVHRTLENGVEVVLSECEGSANTKEKRYRNQDAFMLVNTVQKMAIKRALVGAALQATGASGLFTQDLEDMDFNSRNTGDAQEYGRQKVEHMKQQQKKPASNGKASDAQHKAIYAISNKIGLNQDEVKSIGSGYFKVESISEMTKKQASEFIKMMQSGEPNELHELAKSYITEDNNEEPGPIDISDKDLPF